MLGLVKFEVAGFYLVVLIEVVDSVVFLAQWVDFVILVVNLRVSNKIFVYHRGVGDRIGSRAYL